MVNRTQPAAPQATLLQTLMVRVGDTLCALRASSVREILRPLPLQPVAGMPAFVLGLAVIRGRPVPVVDLCRVLGVECGSAIQRFVTLKVDDRTLALAVESVLGVRRLDESMLELMPSLLEGACGGILESLGARDRGLLLLLRSSRIIPPEVWQALDLTPGGTCSQRP